MKALVLYILVIVLFFVMSAVVSKHLNVGCAMASSNWPGVTQHKYGYCYAEFK